MHPFPAHYFTIHPSIHPSIAFHLSDIIHPVVHPSHIILQDNEPLVKDRVGDIYCTEGAIEIADWALIKPLTLAAGFFVHHLFQFDFEERHFHQIKNLR
jgi:hypothetical protein